jgi:Zinc-uptake complex component A periplasmic
MTQPQDDRHGRRGAVWCFTADSRDEERHSNKNQEERPMKRFFRAALMLLAVGIVLMCPNVAAAADKIKVVATFSVIGDMVTNIAGDLVDLVTIVGPDGDTDLYEPTVADVPKLARISHTRCDGYTVAITSIAISNQRGG